MSDREQLREDLGLFFEQQQNLPPLAGRLYAVLVLSASQGVTFDELVEELQASKSSVSSNLNLLLNLKIIDYFTVCGDRKRYFKTSDLHILRSIERKIGDWNRELSLHKRVYESRKGLIKSADHQKRAQVGLRYNELFIEYSEFMIEQLQALKENIENKIK